MTQRKKIRFGIIGLGLMGREFASAVSRWCHLLDDSPVPVITGICCAKKEEMEGWFAEHFKTIRIASLDYHDLIRSGEIDAIYCAVPHHLHEEIYCNIIEAGKHLLGEKPFGINLEANHKILQAAKKHSNLIIRGSSEFPYFPGAKRVIEWLSERKYGRLMEVRCGFHHSSDMDLNKPLNWKRSVALNGEYGCMGDLGMHVQHIPLRMGWIPKWVFADLQKIVETRPDGSGNIVPCNTWDNAVITCKCMDHANSKEFSLVMEAKRMAPGQTNTWFIEIYGTEGSAKFSTRDPKAFWYLENKGKDQGWTRIDTGSQSFIPTITGAIFEFGFSDAYLQMLGAFMQEFREDGSPHPFRTVSPGETFLSHQIMTAALQSFKTGKRIELDQSLN